MTDGTKNWPNSRHGRALSTLPFSSGCLTSSTQRPAAEKTSFRISQKRVADPTEYSKKPCVPLERVSRIGCNAIAMAAEMVNGACRAENIMVGLGKLPGPKLEAAKRGERSETRESRDLP
eukprot:scaffold96862_cov62-Phaeocystis_antarctica.AAC.2